MGFTPSTALDRHNIHILIVDDDDRIRMLLQKYLTRQGFRTSVAENSEVARDKMRGLSFDLLILDIMMPGEDGLSLSKSLRETSQVPIILLTAKGETADRVSGLRLGVDDYVTKPFEPEELLLRIDNVFRRLGAAPAANNILFGPYTYDIDSRLLTKNGERMRLTRCTGDAAKAETGRKAGGT